MEGIADSEVDVNGGVAGSIVGKVEVVVGVFEVVGEVGEVEEVLVLVEVVGIV